MNILEQITAYKKEYVANSKSQKSVRDLEREELFKRNCYSLKDRLESENLTRIIAEFKRKSPSKGIINANAKVEDVVKSYEEYGAAGVSVLTDELFFGGSYTDFSTARNSISIPLLRKDFMIDEYQFIEAKAWGADVVLLIAAILSPRQVRDFTNLSHDLSMQVLLELHDETELDHVYHEVDMVGINNRNLKTFEVDIEQSIRMANYLDKDFIKIAESGISSIETLKYFKNNGFQGFLMGEYFMKNMNPAHAFKDFISFLY